MAKKTVVQQWGSLKKSFEVFLRDKNFSSLQVAVKKMATVVKNDATNFLDGEIKTIKATIEKEKKLIEKLVKDLIKKETTTVSKIVKVEIQKAKKFLDDQKKELNRIQLNVDRTLREIKKQSQTFKKKASKRKATKKKATKKKVTKKATSKKKAATKKATKKKTVRKKTTKKA